MKMPKLVAFCTCIHWDFSKRLKKRFIMTQWTINLWLLIKTLNECWLNRKFLSLLIAALTVRYLTRRFIGEYRSNTDLLYKQTVTLESGLLDVEIIDVSVDDDDGFPIDQIQWADAVLIVYSIVDRKSFDYALSSLGEIRQLQNGPATYLVANKADLDHLREVRIDENPLYFLWRNGNGTSLLMSRKYIETKPEKVCQQLFIFHYDFSPVVLHRTRLDSNKSST